MSKTVAFVFTDILERLVLILHRFFILQNCSG